ncbi:MAG: hemolysin family protein [Gemmatimonadetes bacterium]|nr:hemolysin family protein [Gemmatimonadota bacterium]
MSLALGLAAAAGAGLAAAAFFAACESAFFALSTPAGEAFAGAERPARGRVERLLARPDRLRHGIALGHLLAVVWTGAVAGYGSVWLMERGAGWPSATGVVAATAFAVLVIGEMAPRALAADRPGAWAARCASGLSAWQALLSPVIVALAAFSRAWDRAVGPGPTAEPMTSEDVRSIVAETTARTDLELGARRMITSIFSFGGTTVREVMTPRPDVVSVEVSTSWEETVRAVRSAEHSRVPVHRESLDDVVGILYAKDLLAVVHGHAGPPDDLESLLREATFIPEAKKIDDLLRAFQRDRIHLAVVVDEYGGTAGIVTLEDVLEELVGEIQDEYDREEPLVEPLADGGLRLDGRLDADDFNELVGTRIDAEGVETIGGVVARELGRIAEGGESVTVEGWTFVVEGVEGKRIVKVRAVPASPEEEPEARAEEGA